MSLSDCSSQGGLQRFQFAEILVKGKEGRSLPPVCIVQIFSPAKWVWACASTGPRICLYLDSFIVCVCVCGCVRSCCGRIFRDLSLWHVGFSDAVRGLQSAQAQRLRHRLSCPRACGTLLSQPGMEPMAPALAGGFLTPGPRGRCPFILSFSRVFSV